MSFTLLDSCVAKLAQTIQSGFPVSKQGLDPDLKSFWNVRHEVFVGLDAVIMYRDRVMVPSSLRESILHVLHSGHQGVSGMLGRAT